MKRSPAELRGWCAIGISTLLACFWAFWGILENFHEGWFQPTLWRNLALMLVQYLSIMLVFVVSAVIGVLSPKAGGLIHFVLATFAAWFFRTASNSVTLVVIVGPLVLIGALYWSAQFTRRLQAISIVVGLPLITILAFGAEPAYRVSHRLNDGFVGSRRITGNGVDLVWAPAGPGWPRSGVSWYEANRRCRYLTPDGKSLADTPQNVWRLPTVDEAVRSMQRHGRNCNGRWLNGTHTVYQVEPDKESPLWDIHSQVIYWWTATGVSPDEALIIVYDGKVWGRKKRSNWGYLGFRAVSSPLPAALRRLPALSESRYRLPDAQNRKKAASEIVNQRPHETG